MFITKDWFIVPDAPGRFFSPSLNKEASYEFICFNYLLCPLEDIGSLLALSKLQVVIEPSLSDCVSIWEFDAFRDRWLFSQCSWLRGLSDVVLDRRYGYLSVQGLPGSPPDSFLMKQVEDEVRSGLICRDNEREHLNNQRLLTQAFVLKEGEIWRYHSHNETEYRFIVDGVLVCLSSSISYANEYDAHSTITLTVEKVFTK